LTLASPKTQHSLTRLLYYEASTGTEIAVHVAAGIPATAVLGRILSLWKKHLQNMQSPNPLSRWDVFLGVSAGLLSLGVYMRTLIPWVLPGDSGEFQVLGYQVGMAHTTGYPIYMLLARLFIWLVPMRDIAYRVNLFSAVMGALTITGVYAAGRILSNNRWAALSGALALTVSFTFWSQSLIAEVYTAGAAFQVAVWAALLSWYKTGDKWALFLAGLCGSIGLGVHANLSLLAPAVGVFLLLNKERWNALWKPAVSGVLAGLGLFVIGFMLVDSHAPPANIWNAAYGPARSAWNLTEYDVQNPLVRFWFIVSAAQWRSAMFVDPLKDTLTRFVTYVFYLPREFSLLTIGLALGGWAVLLRRDKRLTALISAALLIHWIHSFNYRIGDIYVFYIPGYLLIALLATAGLANVSQRIEKVRWRGTTIPQSALMLAFIAGGILPVLVPRLGALMNGRAPFLNARDYFADDAENIYKIAAKTVQQLDHNAIVFTDWTWLYPYYYAAHIEQQRLDLQFVETYSRSDTPGLPVSVVDFIRAKIDAHPIYFSDRVAEVERAGFELRPVYFGFIRFYKVQPASPPP
jgi:hypothetical protein